MIDAVIESTNFSYHQFDLHIKNSIIFYRYNKEEVRSDFGKRAQKLKICDYYMLFLYKKIAH